METAVVVLIIIMDDKNLTFEKGLIDEHGAYLTKIEEVQFFSN